MTIRKATKKDWPAITKLVRAYPTKIMVDHLPRPSEFFVATEGDTVIACCALEVYSKRLAEIRSLAVVKKHQGEGLATMLVQTCLAEAKKKKVYEVLAVTSALTLFKKQGFGLFKKEHYALLKVVN